MKNLILFLFCLSLHCLRSQEVYYPYINVDSSCLTSKYYFSTFYSKYLDSSFTGNHPILPILENKNIRIDNKYKFQVLDNFIRNNYNVNYFINSVGFFPYKRIPYFGYSIEILQNNKNLFNNKIIIKKSYCLYNSNYNIIKTIKYKINLNFVFDDIILCKNSKNDIIVSNDCFIDPYNVEKNGNRTFREYIHFYSLHLSYIEIKIQERFKKGKTLKLILPYTPEIDMLKLSINIDNFDDLDIIDLSNTDIHDIIYDRSFAINYDVVEKYYYYIINIK